MKRISREYPKYAITAVGAVVLRNNNILLVKRGYPPAKGKWSIPGGVIEAGEDIYEAAMRELNEETGLNAKPLGIIWIYNNIVRDDDGRIHYHYVILDVLFDPLTIDGVLRPGGDAVDVAWVPFNEVINRDDISSTVKKLVSRIVNSGIKYIEL